MELNRPLDNHEYIVGDSWDICSMVAPSFYGVIVVISSDVANSIFRNTMIIFVKGLPICLYNELEFIATGLNQI